ncbi:hypothetical protein AB3S75_041152 [Citrus x aurantiifolia]
MEILSGIASKLGELLVDATIKQARYLFCLNSIVKELEDNETNLKEAQDGINEKVEEERQKHCAIVVEKDVEKWLADVVKEMADVRTLKAKIDEKKSRFNGWCPNWGFRYWMDKELPIPRHFMPFGTTESAGYQIIKVLKGDNTKIVGLYGIGGVGKTTLANFVGNQLREENVFDEVGIATVSQDQNIINVQSELVKSLGWELTETYEKDRARRLRMMFSESKSRKMLIILDDVWNQLDLEKVGIPVGDRDNCCKILLTTRLQPVCDRMGCDTQIQLGVLKQDEGLDLLRKHAGIDVADTTLIDVSKRVADECKGLPLAIKAVGSALRGRTADEWNVALDKLQNAKLDKIEEMPALKVVTIIGGVLSVKSLQILTNLQVLQLIRCEVTDASFLEKLKRLQVLYLEESPIEIPDGLGDELSRLKLLYIDTGSISPITINKFPQLEEFYGWIKNWEVEGMSSEESYARCAESDSQPDGSVVWLPKDFSFLKLQRYDINKVDGNGFVIYRGTRWLSIENNHKATLVIFSALFPELENLYLKRVRCCHNIVPSIDERGLNELTRLDVGGCEDLECIMDASKSPHGKSGNPVMLSRLARLYMSELPELKWIWKAPAQHVISLQSLTELSVSKCNNLTYIFTLSLARSLVQLKSLKVTKCERLECIVEAKFDHNEGEISVGDGNTMLALPLLRELRFEDLPELMNFCSENYYSTWPALEVLCLSSCSKLTVNSTELEANLQYLGEKLRILRVGECSHLSDTIPALLKHGLKNLEELGISQLGVQVVFQVEAIIAEGQENKLFPCLKTLQLEDLPELQVLLYHEGPTHNFSLQSLTYLRVYGCTMLRRLFSSTLARNLLQLEALRIWNCSELEQIIDEDEDEDHLQPVCFPKLTRISVCYCPKLKHLFHISVAPSLQKLSRLWIIGNDELEEVFWHKDGADVTEYNEIVMNELRELVLDDLPNLTNFCPAGYQIPVPSASYGVVVHNCPKLRGNSEGDR